MALPGNLLCFLSDVNLSCSPCSVNSDVKCQLLSCHCEALQDSMVDSGVTCSGNGRRTWCLGELHCSGLTEDLSGLTKAGVALPSSLSCTPVRERTAVRGTLEPSQSSLIVHSPPALTGTGIV